MSQSIWRSLGLLRVWFAAAAAALLLASCGGGGGGGGSAEPFFVGRPALQGTWDLTVTQGGVTTPPIRVDASTVPSSQDVADLTTSALAALLARTSFQGDNVTPTGSTIVVRQGLDTYTLVINSITTSNYQDCGTCFVGTSITFDVVMNYTESGTLDGGTIASRTDSTTLRFRYTRVS